MVSLKIAVYVALSFFASAPGEAMTFKQSNLTVVASGPIELGDAAKFAALPPFKVLELNSPGGLVGEALQIATNMDARGGIRTEIKPGARCASACGMALFVSGKTRVVYWGGHLGIHSCRTPDGQPAIECNQEMAANAAAHGVPWGVIEGFGNYTAPSDMHWLGPEEAECWGLMKWNVSDDSNNGIACYKWALLKAQQRSADEVTSINANDVICRMNAGTSPIYVPTGRDDERFSSSYREACERIATNPKTPKYAAIDIIMWLTLTDPQIEAIRPGTLTLRILNNNEIQFNNCWRCYVIAGLSVLMLDHPADALSDLRNAERLVLRDTGSIPVWLASRIDIAAKQAEPK